MPHIKMLPMQHSQAAGAAPTAGGNSRHSTGHIPERSSVLCHGGTLMLCQVCLLHQDKVRSALAAPLYQAGPPRGGVESEHLQRSPGRFHLKVAYDITGSKKSSLPSTIRQGILNRINCEVRCRPLKSALTQTARVLQGGNSLHNSGFASLL